MAGKLRRNSVSDAQIIEIYRKLWSHKKVATQLGIGTSTVNRVLVNHGVKRNGLEHYRRNARKFIGKENAMRRMYERGATVAEILKRYGAPGDAGYSVKQALKRAGTVLRENPAQLVRKGEVERIRRLNAGGMGQVPISLALGRSQSFVSRIMRKNGIPPLSETRRGDKHPNWKGSERLYSLLGFSGLSNGDGHGP